MSQQFFWANKKLEPKRAFKWVARLGDNKQIYSYQIQKVARPELTISNKEVKILGHTFNYPMQATWNQITLDFIDVVENDNDNGKASGQYLKELITSNGYNYPKSFGEARQGITKKQAVNNKFTKLEVEQLDGKGIVLETYTFYNAWVEKVNFGPEFSYESEDLVMPQIGFRYDWAEIKL